MATRYGKARYASIVGGLTDELLEASVALFVAASVLGVLGTAIALRRLIATARRLTTEVEGLLDTTADTTPAESDLAEFTAYSAHGARDCSSARICRYGPHVTNSPRKAPTLVSLGLRVGIVAAGALILANAVLAWIALGAVERRLEPVVEEKARVLARSVANDFATAVRLDIPLQGLRGSAPISTGCSPTIPKPPTSR